MLNSRVAAVATRISCPIRVSMHYYKRKNKLGQPFFASFLKKSESKGSLAEKEQPRLGCSYPLFSGCDAAAHQRPVQPRLG